MSIMKYATATVLFSVPTFAQMNGTFLITSTNTVSPSSPTTTIEMWANWSRPGFFFGAGDYDLTANEGLFSDPKAVLPHFLNTPGIIGPGNVVTGAALGQAVLPGFLGILDNPILIATYTWSTTDFSPRQVNLRTSETSLFVVVDTATLALVDLFPSEFTPGSGLITVVPAPAAWLALAIPLVATRRRRS